MDTYRIKPVGMSICKCGFVSYPSKWKTEEEIVQHYRKEYRPPPTAGNMFTGQRKLHYHENFLAPLLTEWETAKKEAPVVCEIGAAYGMVLDWFSKRYPGAQVSGTELTLSYRRNAYHEFGITLDEQIDLTKKYDLICSYKVAEHQLDFDQKLRQYVEALAEDGHIYISVPTWFGRMCNFGMPGFDLEYYYDPNHINVWTKKLFEVVLAKCGLEIVRSNFSMYDDTYLCKRNDAVMSEPREFENPEEIKERMGKIKEAALKFMESDFEGAVLAYPNFPDAYPSIYEKKRAEYDKLGFDGIVERLIEPAIAACPDAPGIFNMAADIALRYEQFLQAKNYLEIAHEMRPENPATLIQFTHLFRGLAQKAKTMKERIHYHEEARGVARHLGKVSTQHLKDSLDWRYYENANIPAPFETPSV